MKVLIIGKETSTEVVDLYVQETGLEVETIVTTDYEEAVVMASMDQEIGLVITGFIFRDILGYERKVDGLHIATIIKQHRPDVKVVVMSTYKPMLIDQYMESGIVDGFSLKDSNFQLEVEFIKKHIKAAKRGAAVYGKVGIR